MLSILTIAWSVCILEYVLCETATYGPEYLLKHDFGSGTFHSRGKIYLPGAKRKDAEPSVLPENIDPDFLRHLHSQKGSGIYRIKMVDSKHDSDNSTLVMGYTQSGKLLSSSLHDVITIYCDDFDNVIGVAIRAFEDVVSSGHASKFETTLLTESPDTAPIPDTTGFLEKLKEEKIQKEKADKEPQSFFGKYWMYIVPVAVFMLLSNAQQQQGS